MKHILWGGATSASQYEGGFKDGKGIDTQDCRPYLPRTSNATTETRLLTQKQIDEAKNKESPYYYPFRVGTKGYEYGLSDIDLLKDLDLDIYRLSISWSRLFPTGEELKPNPVGVEYYDKILNKLHDAGIKIFITIDHYAIPLNLVEKYKGWTSIKTVNAYMRFSSFLLQKWGSIIDYWLPINEINAGYFSPYNGVALVKPQNGTYSYNDIFLSLHHQFIASAKTIELGKELNIKGKFCAMISCFCYYPLTPKPEDNLEQVKVEEINQWFCMDVLAKGEYPYYAKQFFKEHDVHFKISAQDKELLKNNICDIVTFSYYDSSICSVEENENQTAGNLVATTKNPFLKATRWGWQIDPIGLRTTLHKVYDRYNKPVMISENGMGAKDILTKDHKIHDQYRIDYFNAHFNQIIKAVKEGVDVRAYIAWGIIDIISAGSCEMDKRYGVVYVDADNTGNGTFKRYKKDSFDWYKHFIESQRKKKKE
ncbi:MULTISPECIES: glycoside hydrolase family 1 protein [unclassified Lactobacillus]|uniref:glycoside hydrolase family 1 protein n=1 Tax=unclassified Lactobacillus TaxID=2620435 RepID=UPI002269A01D|nr:MULTISPECIES: glycoside hydrolase family 1 protein [unclassified Lactobacillus]MCX8722038.1 glycoside hydrolase family 1 protein [Lactobacillus sp. B4010]MCX8732676.1 glycoside hydrolase family 1 protein [Lactobacillus sp. B4015]MCX8734896.1 glycoside hydrolase family 1 protein [Lactobacillus sp. B4012]